MRALVALILLAFPAAAQEGGPQKCLVKNGKTSGVFYGMSFVMDLWGNTRRQVWTLRPDGILVWGAPEEPLESYQARALTAEEKAAAGAYAIDGTKFHLTWRDGSKSEGTVEYDADGSIKKILAGGLHCWPVFIGTTQPLSGYWSNTTSFNNGAYKMSTTAYTNYSFFSNGIFVNETGASTIATGVETKTRESGGYVETIRQEVTKFYGSDPSSKMGKFEVKGSTLTLTYDNGKKVIRYIGQISATKPGEEAFVVIGNSLYSGSFGVFPRAAGAPAAAPAPASTAPAGLGRCASEHFSLAIPAGWHARQEDLEGIKAFLITPSEDPEGRFTLVLTSTGIDNPATKSTDPEMVASLEALVKGWVKNEKVEKEGEPEPFKVGGVDAIRLRFSMSKDGVPVKIEAACAVRDGHALVALTLASEDSLRRHGAAARELLGKAELPQPAPGPKVELQKVKADHYELEVPKAWTAKELEQNGTKSWMIVPPSGEAEFVMQVILSEAGVHETALAPAAVQELRDLVKQLAPALEPVGSLQTLKAGGQPVAGVVYGGRNEKNEVVLLKAYLTLIKGGKSVVVLVVGKETRHQEYGAQLLKAIESLTLR